MKNYGVIIPPNHPNPPEPHEIDAANIVAHFLRTQIQFLIPSDMYKQKTPDVVVLGRTAEIKSPQGNSRKHTVRAQFRRASHQLSIDIIFDGRRTKLGDDFLLKEIKKEIFNWSCIQRVYFIMKDGEVVETNKKP